MQARLITCITVTIQWPCPETLTRAFFCRGNATFRRLESEYTRIVKTTIQSSSFTFERAQQEHLSHPQQQATCLNDAKDVHVQIEVHIFPPSGGLAQAAASGQALVRACTKRLQDCIEPTKCLRAQSQDCAGQTDCLTAHGQRLQNLDDRLELSEEDAPLRMNFWQAGGRFFGPAAGDWDDLSKKGEWHALC